MISPPGRNGLTERCALDAPYLLHRAPTGQFGSQAGHSARRIKPCGQGSTQSEVAWIGQFSSQIIVGPVCGGQVQPCATAAGLPGSGCVSVMLVASGRPGCRRCSLKGCLQGTTPSDGQSLLPHPRSVPCSTLRSTLGLSRGLPLSFGPSRPA